jgi:hypothetical protein
MCVFHHNPDKRKTPFPSGNAEISFFLRQFYPTFPKIFKLYDWSFFYFPVFEI